ncbi:hypothetical protein EOA32_00740 [Mesorhizobium sp. M1A.F.Ca.ET.072.01.1.1]|uniref:hypothetical protein n=1 Tax=Mesorhizobium sp. M1A.F.Ca.ET.072.01.1.1 TaxID=2496753 RepID=UPI000FD5FC90|nr:hypothetical protein [Mesorhizobium sp. M1A.F.Ca.ET.072.01.1.1]RUW55578.1 hypothetical protein EOA32_00740 [Mesorhizobium sp. M1A.F.Ca.ET.072.01.1.1]
MTTGYYVTVKRGNRTGWLFGPVADHAVALAMVDPVRRLACTVDPWCDFDAFGTSSITTTKKLPPGKLNDQWQFFR